MYKTPSGKFVCGECLKPISKSGHIRKHFDDAHNRIEPNLLKESEAHLNLNGNAAAKKNSNMEIQNA